MRRTTGPVLLVPLALVALSCNLLQVPSWGQRSPFFSPPTLAVGDVALTARPSLDALARWYCPDLIGAGGALACSALLGPSPSEAELAFVFSVPIDVGNPNAFPLPALEALVSLTLFPATTDRTLGAVCASFCDDATCAGLPDAGTCRSAEPELKDVGDFAAAALRLLTLAAGGTTPDLGVPTIAAHGSRRLTLSIAIDVGTVLELLANELAERWQDYLSNRAVTLAIPYEVDGTLWFVVEGVGRVGFGFGPLAGTWSVE